MRILSSVMLLVILLASCQPALSARDAPKATPSKLAVKLGKIPDLNLTPRPASGAVRAKQVKRLIADLANLDRVAVGLSPSLGGWDFAPVPGQAQASAVRLTDHRVQPSNTFCELVALGPDALPHLLDALDDKTPTKLTINHNGPIGAMGYGDELELNPVNPAEVAVYKARAGAGGRRANRLQGLLDSYTVTVGDVCFVAVGQIVGRSYSAVRYQPSASIVINSPAHNARLCADVRTVWTGGTPTRTLFESLLADYATEGVFNGRTLDGWSTGSRLQCGAALRLLYYFPTESGTLIAVRLNKLDVTSASDLNDYIRRCVANGVRADAFIKAVSWSTEPDVRLAIAGVFKRADGLDTLLAALPGVYDKNLIRGRLEPLVEKLPAEEDSFYGTGYSLLVALCTHTPDTAKAVVDRYILRAGVQRRATVCELLKDVQVPWDRDVLAPLLDDQRATGRTYPADPRKTEPRLPLRICDMAADALAHNHPEVRFILAGPHAELDKQIAAMRERLNQKE